MKNYIVLEQHSFVKNKSTIINLLIHSNEFAMAIDNVGQLDCVSMNITKAFDRLLHILLYKLTGFDL